MSRKTPSASIAWGPWGLVVFIGAAACDSGPAAAPGFDGAADSAEPDLLQDTAASDGPPDTSDSAPDTVPPEDTSRADSAPEDTSPDTNDLPETTVVADAVDTAVPPECMNDSDCDPGLLCLEGACSCDPTPVSFAADLVPLFAATCGKSCHIVTSPNGGSAGLNLSAAFAYAELVGVDASQCAGVDRRRVVPGDIGASYLYDKLRGRQMCSGSRMPRGRPAYTVDQLSLVGRWICQGASDN